MVWFTADRSSIPVKKMNEKNIYVTKTAVKMGSHCALFTLLDCIFPPFLICGPLKRINRVNVCFSGLTLSVSL